MIEIIWKSFLLVAATEMGDKTQLLAIALTAKFRKPIPIMLGILMATIANHLLASMTGVWVSQHISSTIIHWIVGIGFIGFSIWVLIPDREEDLKSKPGWGPFMTTFIAFFLAEMGDKTQLATVALSLKFGDVILVTLGTTMGMMFADGLAVAVGQRFLERVPMKYVRYFAAALFLFFGVAALMAAV